jgi:hypothetical protein
MADEGSKQVRVKLPKGLRNQNSYLLHLGYGQEDRANQLGLSERTIQRYDREDRGFVLYGVLKAARYPEPVIDQILEAVNGPKQRLDESGEWHERIRKLLLEPGETRDTWFGDDLEKYIRTIRVAETLDDFETQFADLLQKQPDSDTYAVVKWLADRVCGDIQS